MNIFVVGLSHKTSPVEVREKIALNDEDIKALKELLGFRIREISAISTCNRVEFYFWGEREGVEEILELLDRRKSVSPDKIRPFLYIKEGEEAVTHIFRVASSLDSMVLGEPQIVGQFKDAFELSQKERLTGPVLNQLLSKALSTSKRVRTKTGIGQSAISVSYAAVELAEKIFGDLKNCIAALVGAGEMAVLAAKHLKESGVSKMLVVNRTFERAKEIAEELNAEPLPFEKLEEAVSLSDIVIASTAAKSFILTKSDVERIMKKRKHKPLFLIDIAVPRNIDPQVNNVENVFLYNIDDLEAVVEENRRRREREAVKAEAIVAEEAEKFMSWLKTQEVVPLIVALREKAEKIKKMEVSKTASKLNLSDKELKSLEAMGSAIINKLLHPVLNYIKKSSLNGDAEKISAIVREMFALEEEKNENKAGHKGK